MPVTRSYRCTDCGTQFTHFHLGRDEPYPACPSCPPAEAQKPVEWAPQGFNIKTNRSRAIDYTQSMAETQFGLTNIKDNLREGDIAAPSAPGPSSQEQAAMQEMMRQAHEAANAPAAPLPPEIPLQSFWSQAGAAPLDGQPMSPTAPVAGAAEARASGLDAVSLVEKAQASGQGRMKLQVVARGQE